MKHSILRGIIRIFFLTIWRILLTAVLLCATLVIGAYMVFSTVFTGPSETARNMLTTVLMESAITREIPIHFLGESTVREICGSADNMGTSDPSLITVSPDLGPEDALVVPLEFGEAEIAYFTSFEEAMAACKLITPASDHAYGVGDDGILVLLDSETNPTIRNCGATLVLDGQANEGLLNGNMGYAPYTAIGQRADGMFLLVTAKFANYRDLVNIMYEYDAVNACVLGIHEHYQQLGGAN